MRSFILLVSLLTAIVEAQTPYGFSPATSAPLLVTFANNTRVNRGALLAQSSVAKQPDIRLANGSLPSTTFMQFMFDIDVPAQNGSKTTFLHLAQSNLKPASNGTTSTASNSTSSTSSTSNNTAPYANTTSNAGAPGSANAAAAALNASLIEASYVSPSPPPNSGAHRYVVMLFAQPSNFSVPAAFSTVLATADSSPGSRAGFDINGFAIASGLGTPIGSTFFTVQNDGNGTSANGTSTNGTAAAGASNSTGTPAFSGLGTRSDSPSVFGLAVLVSALVLGLY